MDWKDLAGTLAKTGAPIIGTALGGPLGGTIGGVVGNIIASSLGVEATPEAVNSAITTGDPTVVNAALARAEAEVTAKWQAIIAIAQAHAEVDKINAEQINETIRAEIGTISWWHWRSLIGYLVLGYGAVLLAVLIKAAFFSGGVSSIIKDLVELLNSQTTFILGLFGLLGYVAQDTSKLKSIAVTGEQPKSAVAEIVKAVKKK